MPFIKKLVFVMLLFCSVTASAELYKWTDAQGNIHFSDTKPEIAKPADITGVTVPHVPGNARDANGTSYARLEKPIKNSHKLSRTIELSRVSIDMERIFSGAVLGRELRGRMCKVVSNNFIASHKRYAKVKNTTNVYFKHAVRKFGYALAEKKQSSLLSLFDGGNSTSADLSLVVEVNDIQTNSCVKKFIGVRKHDLSSYHQASWTLYENKSGEIIYEGITKGYKRSLYHSSEVYSKGIDENNGKSIQNMIANLFADKEFVGKLAK